MEINNDEFFNELRTSTELHAKIKREEKEAMEVAYVDEMKAILNELYIDITNGLKERMLSASKQGHYFTSVYEFGKGEMFKDKKVVFLLKGPMNNRFQNKNGLHYFETKGIEPIIVKLNNEYKPIVFYFRYDRISGSHKIIANWSMLMES